MMEERHNHLIRHTQLNDVPGIYELFDHSVHYQERNGYPSWRNYDKNAVIRDIEERKQYKIEINGQVAIVFSICDTDKIIWRDLDEGQSVYLHRIVVNPAFKGRKLFGHILHWVTAHARARGVISIRMDTWAGNENLIAYYAGFGFRVVEYFTTPDSTELPVHNRGLSLVLLEYLVGGG